MNRYYFTFGQAHAHRVNGNTFDKDCVCIILADNEVQARQLAFDAFGREFCFSYSEQYWDKKSMKFYPRGYIHLNKTGDDFEI